MPKPSELISLYVALSGAGSTCRPGSVTRQSLPVQAGNLSVGARVFSKPSWSIVVDNGFLGRGVAQRPIEPNCRYLLHDQGDVQRIDHPSALAEPRLRRYRGHGAIALRPWLRSASDNVSVISSGAAGRGEACRARPAGASAGSMQKTHGTAMAHHFTHNSNAAPQHYHRAGLLPTHPLSKPDISPD
jgi:hypothetical protein